MSHDVKKMEGVFTELPVPLLENLSIDYESLGCMIRSQVHAGISGIYLHGVSGETMLMSWDEELELIARSVDIAQGKLPVIANLLASGQEQACAKAKAYAQTGIDVLSISQPLFYPYTESGLLEYFSAVISSVNLPILIYNMPSAGYILSPKLIGTLARQYPQIIAYKDSTQNVMHLQDVAAQAQGTNMALCAGSDATFYSTLCTGGAGIVSLVSMLFPQEVIRLYQLYRGGNREGALQQQQFILKIRSALKAAPLIAGYKTAAKQLGLYRWDCVRPPLSNTTDADALVLRERLHALGVV